jgi:hypothetical protein
MATSHGSRIAPIGTLSLAHAQQLCHADQALTPLWVARESFVLIDARHGEVRDVWGVVPRAFPLGCAPGVRRSIRRWQRQHPAAA